MKKRFDIIGAPFNQLGFVTTEQNTVDGLRCMDERSGYGLTDSIGIRNARWGADIQDVGDVPVSAKVQKLINADFKEAALSQYCSLLKEKVQQSITAGRTPITLGGDHSIAIGTIQAVKAHYGKKVAVVWVDAHADCNTGLESNLHGKPLALLMNRYQHNGWKLEPELTLAPEDIYYVAVRDLMPCEHQLISELGMTNYDMAAIDNHGFKAIVDELIARLERDYDHIYLSFDYDALDGTVFRACATPNVGGLSARESLHLVHTLSLSPKFVGADFVEYMPELDDSGVSKQLMIKLLDAVWGFRT